MAEQGSWKRDSLVLTDLLSEEPIAQARYYKLKDYQKEMCLRWIAEAPTPALREQRIRRLARRLWLLSFDPYYELGYLTLDELDDVYGSPRPLHHLPPEEQALALEEQRVLGAYHYRNFDDGGTSFYIAAPGSNYSNSDILLVYAPPCRLTERVVSWMNRNNLESAGEMFDYFGGSEYRQPSGAPAPEPLRIEDPAAGELRPESERHAGPVLAVACIGRRTVSASADGTLRVWDAAIGQSLHVLTGHTGAVGAVALTRDGREAVSASSDGTVRIWGVEDGQLRAVMSGHEAEVCALALLEDRQAVISTSADGTLRVWYLPSGSGNMVLRGHTGAVLDVALTVDGQRAVSTSADGTLRVWDMVTGQTQHVLAGHNGAVLDVALTQDGRRAVSVSADGTLRVWDLATGRAHAILVGHKAEVRAVDITAGGQDAISASADGTFRVWNITGYCYGGLRGINAGHSGAITGIASLGSDQGGRLAYISPGSIIAVNGLTQPGGWWGTVSASADSTLRLWDLKKEVCLAVFEGAYPFTCCVGSPDGQTLAAGDNQGQVHFLRLGTG